MDLIEEQPFLLARRLNNNLVSPFVTTYTTLSHFYDVRHQGLMMILAFLTVANWSIRHRINVKVSFRLLRTVDFTVL